MLWGNTWGQLNRWGDSALVYSTTSQGVDPLAKDDTLYYGRGSTMALLATDRSQYLDNQTVGATWTYEASPATRYNVTGAWCVEVDVDVTNATIGRFFNYSAGASEIGLRIAAGGIITALTTIVVGTLTLPGISASSQRYIISWAVEPNLATTGAGDAMVGTIRAWNVATGAYDQTTWTYAARPSGTGNFVWWSNSTAGANTFTGTARACRFSSGRPRTSVETREDFIGRSAAPAPDGATAVEFPIVDPLCALRDPGQFAGPVHAMGAASATLASLRTFSPIVNIQPIDNVTFTSTLSAIPAQWRTGTSVSGELCGHLLFKRPIPPTATHATVRVRLSQTAAGSDDRLTIRVYSMNHPPGAGRCTDHTSAFQSRSVSRTSSSTGEGWLEFADLELVRNSRGETWIGVSLDGLVSGSADSFTFDALTVEPIVV